MKLRSKEKLIAYKSLAKIKRPTARIVTYESIACVACGFWCELCTIRNHCKKHSLSLTYNLIIPKYIKIEKML